MDEVSVGVLDNKFVYLSFIQNLIQYAFLINYR